MSILFFITIVMGASVLQTSTGFGFSIVATPFLLLLFEPADAIQINLLLSIVISGCLLTTIAKDVDTGVLKRFIAGSIFGLPIGAVIFLLLDMTKLKLGISVLIIVLTLLLIFQFRIRQSKKGDALVGGISGSLTSSVGMPGPPLLLYFAGTGTQKATLRATTLAFYLFIYVVSLLIQWAVAGVSRTVWTSSGIALPFVVIGLFAGQLLFKRINENTFRVVTYIILLGTGLYLLVDSLRDLFYIQ
ncbi:sulfite exporter TauE/SafE family protein [Sporosarcina cyprini]|uniref:sulfite exporter TauE/SafE family protein n=1 Tax=Sporosarcina cyprini TaxID=2910523 RepID=UPI001EDCC09A|nr:sulfite exporter TauE/SafE family protein [Sporosarcina cyprini]MCG3087312.1 sulfite exporter TauE/SafE family protein [Sporosarcina cyprini]